MRHVSFGARMMARYPKITQYCRLCSGKIAARLWCFLPLCQFLRTGSCSLSRFIYRSDLPLEDVKHVTPPLKRFLFSSKQVLQARTETKHAVERSAGCRCTQAVRVVVWGHLCVLWCVETRSFPPQQPCTLLLLLLLLYSSASSDRLADVHKTTTAHFRAFLLPF